MLHTADHLVLPTARVSSRIMPKEIALQLHLDTAQLARRFRTAHDPKDHARVESLVVRWLDG